MSKPKNEGDDSLSRARRRIQSAVEQEQERHRRDMLKKRIELAHQSIHEYQNKNFAEAVRGFQSYLQILEDWKGVGEGGLIPSLFDSKAEAPELLLITGVFWDLAKLYDRTKSQEKYRDFLGYIEKYVVFSRNTPYQTLAAEALRKYIVTSKPLHRQEFKNAYESLTGSKACFVATALSDVIRPETMPRLRQLRDERLERHVLGRAFVSWYYGVGPGLARGVARLPFPMRKALGKLLDLL